jgi:hypothetical protein
MYKNPQLSDTAKRLRTELNNFGCTVTHAQALEIAARLEGARTLHVAQAKKNAGVKIASVAKAQAQAVMFESLGAYVGRVDTLMAELDTLPHLTARDADELYRRIFRRENPVVLRSSEDVRADDIPVEFAKLVQRLQDVLVAQAQAPQPQESDPLYEGPMLDWRVLEDDDAPAYCREQAYRVVVKRSGHQFYVDIAPPHESPEDLDGKPQLSLFIEVNNGLPCVHMGNHLFNDQVLTVFSTQDGLYLRPDANDLFIRTGVPGEELPGLQAQYERETEGPFSARAAMNHAFIAAQYE